MIWMLLIGCCFGIRSERRLCDKVHLPVVLPARTGLVVPDHPTFPRTDMVTSFRLMVGIGFIMLFVAVAGR